MPLEWIEVARRLLIGNSTLILGRKVSITRGCLQGSPLSPLLCNFLFEDLFRYLKSKYTKGGIPNFPPCSSPQHAELLRKFDALLTLLAYADDTSGLSTQTDELKRIAHHIAEWHKLRRLTLSTEKSDAVVFTAPPKLPLPTTHKAAEQGPGEGCTNPCMLDPITLNNKQVQWAPGTKYLGMRFYAQPKSWSGGALQHVFSAADLTEIRTASRICAGALLTRSSGG